MIYKYSRVNEHSISNLIRNKLYCQNYKAFNDPFECWFILKEGIPDPEKDIDRFKMICDAWGYTPQKNHGNFEDYVKYMDELEMYQPDIQEFVDRARISCFSKEINNLLMWAHYADGMRGFCIEYDENLLLSNNSEINATIIPVAYSDSPPIVDKMVYALADDQIWYNEIALEEEPKGKHVNDYRKGLKAAKKLANNIYTKTIATKPKQWKYEKEIRLIYYSENTNTISEFFHFPPESIKSIIVGEKMDFKARETLSKIIDLKNLHIQKKIAKRNTGSYQIKFETFK